MRALMKVLRRTWLATTLFVLVSTLIWWKWLDWESAREHLLPTLFVSPLIWWVAVGRQHSARLVRGVVAGAITGLLTQLLPDLPTIWGLLSHPGAGDGEAQAIAVASVVVFVMIGGGAALIGAVIGLVTAAIERRTQEPTLKLRRL